MAMNAGDTGCTSGLAQVIYNYRTGDSAAGFSSPLSSSQATALKHDCYQLALSIVSYLQAHAEVSITVPVSAMPASACDSPARSCPSLGPTLTVSCGSVSNGIAESRASPPRRIACGRFFERR